MLFLGVGAIGLGLALLFFLGPQVMMGGRSAIASGGLMVWGLVMVGRHVGTT